MRAWPVLLLLLATLAGCSSADEAAREPVQALPGIGNLRGLVVDDAITPLAGVKVVVKELGLETVTGTDGMFGVNNLEEGPHRIRATLADHAPVELTVHIVAGVTEPEAVRLQMARTPGTIPLAVPAIHSGWIGCEVLILYALQNCDAGTSTFGPPDNHVLMNQPDDVPDAVHVEVAWEAAQDFASDLTLTYGTCTGIEYCDPQPPSKSFLCSAWSASPLWCRVSQTSVERSGGGPGHQNLRDTAHGTMPLTGLAIHVGASGGNCMPSPYHSYCLGAVVQQEIAIFTWSFYNFEPAEGWSFVADGAPGQ